ncbi:twin-arginine translocase TatA/TatE family subunit [Nocardioides lijunqiniae]|uniref:twin-arginine translocase TatA/TatE family subunit n=1 Tax=Nocardioides lijunqiniae TaxID=2760832 RepID=UPI001D0C2943|nr:twin-arginine translocase TatA/TatE family subunit [Nocardioides lijunqiniae]
MLYPLIGMPAGAEWLIILAIVILVFGAAKLPALARSTGQSLRIFKAETKGLRDDDDPTEPTPPATPAGELPTAAPEATVAPVEPVADPLPGATEHQTPRNG